MTCIWAFGHPQTMTGLAPFAVRAKQTTNRRRAMAGTLVTPHHCAFYRGQGFRSWGNALFGLGALLVRHSQGNVAGAFAGLRTHQITEPHRAVRLSYASVLINRLNSPPRIRTKSASAGLQKPVSLWRRYEGCQDPVWVHV